MAIAEKKDEKVEKRRALGRGLESLLPGPRVVGPSPESRVPGTERGGGGAPEHESGGAGEKQVPFDSPSPVGSGSLRAGSHFVRNDKGLGGDGEETKVPRFARDDSESLRQQASPPFAKDAKDGAPIVEEPSGDVISIHGQAMPGNLVVNLDIELIEKNPYQTRYVFDEETLIELKESIKEHGVVQPVVVRPAQEEGRYILVLGERRLRASKMAGKETIPALVRRVSPQQAAEMTVLENVVREDLNPLEQAEAFRVLSREFHLTQAQIAERVGVSRETVSNYMRLLKLPQKVMGYMLEERLTFSDARMILGLENPEHIEALADEVVTKHMKWDEIEDRVRRINGDFPLLPGQSIPGGPKQARWMDPNVRAAQMDLERTLGLRVRIRDRNGKGRVSVDYASLDEFERITSLLRGKGSGQ